MGYQSYRNRPKRELISLNVSNLNSIMWYWMLKQIYLRETGHPLHKTGRDFK